MTGLYYPDIYAERWDEITMEDAEQFYSTTLHLEKEKTIIDLTAPLLVCMALHGQKEQIAALLEKFPLISEEGWTPALEEEIHYNLVGYTVIRGEDRLSIVRRMTIESAYDMLESDVIEFARQEVEEKKRIERTSEEGTDTGKQ